jgi:peptide chain release factor 2
MQTLKTIKSKVKLWQELKKRIDDFSELLDIAAGEEDVYTLHKEKDYLDKELQNLEITILLSGKFDANAAIVDINAGAGGTEACDWAGMLFRMYGRWAERRGYKVKVVDVWEEEGKGLLKRGFWKFLRKRSPLRTGHRNLWKKRRFN